jgi:hypothetical protein
MRTCDPTLPNPIKLASLTRERQARQAGNDFLPNVPSLEIYDRPSALDTLLDTYKASLRAAGKYLTSSGKVRRGCPCRQFVLAW